jgi:hypothetical protein
VQNRLDSLKVQIATTLNNYRVWRHNEDGAKILPYFIGPYYSSVEIFSKTEYNIIDSLGLNISIDAIYDDKMRNRIIQIMNNEYQEWELDTLINRYISSGNFHIERDARKNCRFDTLEIFKATLDSFYTELKKQRPEDSTLVRYESAKKYQYEFEIFKLLQLDTTILFKQEYDRLVERKKKDEKNYLLNGGDYNYNLLAELCGYISDTRFVESLKTALNSSNKYNFKREIVIDALVRISAEPYYSNYINDRSLSMAQILDETRLNFGLGDFVFVLRTQDSFRELSKYLLSGKPYMTDIIDCEDHIEFNHTPVSSYAFSYIRDHIENKDLHKIIKEGRRENDASLLISIYEWMQKNYGKYEIRKLW